MRTDLHCHSTASDGVYAPRALVRLARDRAVDVIALTDHDTIAGHPEAIAAGREFGVRVIPGIEISSLAPQGEVHILGYGVEPDDGATRDTILSLRATRERRARHILDKLYRLSIVLDFDHLRSLAGDGMIGRPHIARAMVEKGTVRDVQEAFDVYLAEGKAAFVPNDALDPFEAVDLIHRARGIAVIAHPAFVRGDVESLIASLIARGLDGIEVYYPDHTSDQISRFADIARSADLVVTGGSDFHGLSSDAVHAFGEIALPDDAVARIEARIAALRG